MGYNKYKLYKFLHYWFRDMVNFNYPEKGLELVSLSHFVYDFSKIMFLMLYSINWPNFNVWLPLFLEILDNMCITFAWYPGCDVIKFETNIIFLIQPFCCMTKKSRQKLKYLENEKSFWGEIRSTLYHFWRSFNSQKLSQIGQCAFKHLLTVLRLMTIMDFFAFTKEITKSCSVAAVMSPNR